MQKDRSFTLIELLVVIAIIGLISSLVLVNIGLPTQKQKARIAKTLEFSSSVQNTLGAEAVGVWNFDNNVSDASGYGNNGIINGGAIFATNTPQQIIGQSTGKYSLSFDGVDDYVDAGNGASLTLTKKATLETWIFQRSHGPASGNWPNIVGKSQFRIYHNPSTNPDMNA